MVQAASISFADVLELLRGAALDGFESKYAAQRGYVISPRWGDSQKLTKELAFIGICRRDIEDILISRGDQLSRFIDAASALPDYGEEWPEGEEPGEGPETIEGGESIVFGRGFSMLGAATLWILERRKEPELLRWLKVRRIPHYKKHAADLRVMFDNQLAQR